jgi:hypothetical protein
VTHTLALAFLWAATPLALTTGFLAVRESLRNGRKAGR